MYISDVLIYMFNIYVLFFLMKGYLRDFTLL